MLTKRQIRGPGDDDSSDDDEDVPVVSKLHGDSAKNGAPPVAKYKGSRFQGDKSSSDSDDDDHASSKRVTELKRHQKAVFVGSNCSVVEFGMTPQQCDVLISFIV